MKGKLFVIDGTDGSGKQTQFQRLAKRLESEGIEYRTVSFPNYDSQSSSLVKMYLSGEFGTNAQEISPYIASTFYAVDRYATFKTGYEDYYNNGGIIIADRYTTFKKDYQEYYNNGGIILADRYTTANMVHQAGKIKDKQEREKFLNWLFDLEFNLYGLPIPTEVFFLKMPVKISEKLMLNRENKFSKTTKKDIHEINEKHLQDSYDTACELAKEYNWFTIECIKNGKIRTIDDIHEEIYLEVKKYL